MSISEKLSPAGVNSRLKVLSLYGEVALKDLQTQPDYHIRKLTSLKEKIEKSLKKPPSRPRLFAAYTIEQAELVRRRIHIRKPTLFGASSAQSLASWFDIEYGVRETVSRIFVAERAIAEGPDAPITDIVNHSPRDSVSAVDDAEYYLHLQKIVSEAVALLKEDPSGFLLLDTFVGQLKAGQTRFISPDRTPEFVVAGAELAQRIYKEIYPLSERLPVHF